MTTQSSSRLSRLLRGIGALIVLVAVVAGIPLLLASLHMVPHSLPSLHELGRELKQRDNGQVASVVIAAGVWICWALFTMSLIPEIAAAARKRPARLLPGVAVFQRPAGALVSAIAIGFTVAPLIAGVATAGRAAGTAPPLAAVTSAAQVAATVPAPKSATPAPPDARAALEARNTPLAAHTTPAPAYQVQHRDTLWKIAEDHLGDPMRYPEIVKLNPGAIGPDNEITPGTVLTLPADATAATTHGTPAQAGAKDVRVQPATRCGTSRSGSPVRARTGPPAGRRTRAAPSRVRACHRPEPDRPGWTLSIPAGDAATSPPVTHRPAPPAVGRTRRRRRRGQGSGRSRLSRRRRPLGDPGPGERAEHEGGIADNAAGAGFQHAGPGVVGPPVRKPGGRGWVACRCWRRRADGAPAAEVPPPAAWPRCRLAAGAVRAARAGAVR
jgi:hypothetical protein